MKTYFIYFTISFYNLHYILAFIFHITIDTIHFLIYFLLSFSLPSPMVTTHPTTTATPHYHGSNTPRQRQQPTSPYKNLNPKTHKKIKAKSTQNPQNLNPKGKPIPKSKPIPRPQAKPTTNRTHNGKSKSINDSNNNRTHGDENPRRSAQTHQDPPQTQPNKSPQTIEIHPQTHHSHHRISTLET